MADSAGERRSVKVDCPHCGTRLVIDAEKGVVLESLEPANPRKETDLKDAQQVLKDESDRIHERYRQIVEKDKGRSADMEKKFKDFLEKAKDEPVSKPVKDIDMD